MDDNIHEIDITELARNSPLMARLMEEVRLEKERGVYGYNRMHNRHNRSVPRTSPVRVPEPPPKEPTPPSESDDQDKKERIDE